MDCELVHLEVTVLLMMERLVITHVTLVIFQLVVPLGPVRATVHGLALKLCATEVKYNVLHFN